MLRVIGCFIVLTIVSGFVSSGSAQDWPGWRGAERNDRSGEKGLLQSWPTEGPTRLWTCDTAGLGYAGFSVVGEKLFTLGLDNKQEFAICLNVDTGEELWRVPVAKAFKDNWGDGPRSTPTIDGDRIYCMFARGTLACLNIEDGNEIWKQEMKDLGGSIPQWGFAESPLVDGDLVICTPGGDKGSMAALNKATGELVWQTHELDSGAHYSSPILMEINGEKQYVQLLVNRVVGINPADGAVNWQSEWGGQTAVIPTPVDVGGKVYVTSGYRAGSRLLQINDPNSPEELWFGRSVVNHHGGMILVGEHLFGYSDAAGFVCQKVSDGELAWNNRQIGKGCLTWADGRFYYVEEDSGDVLLIEANDEELKIHGKFTMEPQTEQRKPAGRIWTHPVIAGGRLFVRDQEFIHCYDIKDQGMSEQD